jgi:hypothetical protein
MTEEQTAETVELMDLDIFEERAVELLEANTYSVTIKNAIWNDEKGYILLFLMAESDKDTDDIAEIISFPKKGDPNRTVKFKQQRLQSWVSGTGLQIRRTSELSDPEVWKGLQASVEIVVEVTEEYGTQNKVQSVHAQ